ncbi:MAG: BolA family protein [Gammaproteobacteria bacterium]
MTTIAEERVALIKHRITESLAPSFLEVIDESDQHVGHAGHQGGGRHFAVVIRADKLQGLPRVAAHREVYQLFSDMMPDEIHALKIKII